MSARRAERTAELVHAELARLLRTEVKDPRVGVVSITHVRMSGDLRHATVHIAPLGGRGDSEEMLAGLNSALGFLRREVGRALRLKHAPALHFRVDDGVDEAVRMTELLTRMERERGHRDEEPS
ncbi:MAG: 30S ribosome-binding factor RbfA [Alphaproteobacteria bacterium]|nr:30S ribosome-binding factor RbfA [Alphaproteobacteria bacterium]